MSPRAAEPAEPDLPSGADPATGRRLAAVAAAIVAAEAVALLVFAGYLLVNLVGGSEETTATSNTVIEIVAFAVMAVLLALVARGVLRCRRWARAPLVVTQLLTLLGPGWNMLQGDLWYRWVLGLPLTVGAAVALVLALTPAVSAAIEENEAGRG